MDGVQSIVDAKTRRRSRFVGTIMMRLSLVEAMMRRTSILETVMKRPSLDKALMRGPACCSSDEAGSALLKQ